MTKIYENKEFGSVRTVEEIEKISDIEEKSIIDKVVETYGIEEAIAFCERCAYKYRYKVLGADSWQKVKHYDIKATQLRGIQKNGYR